MNNSNLIIKQFGKDSGIELRILKEISLTIWIPEKGSERAATGYTAYLTKKDVRKLIKALEYAEVV